MSPGHAESGGCRLLWMTRQNYFFLKTRNKIAITAISKVVLTISRMTASSTKPIVGMVEFFRCSIESIAWLNIPVTQSRRGWILTRWAGRSRASIIFTQRNLIASSRSSQQSATFRIAALQIEQRFAMVCANYSDSIFRSFVSGSRKTKRMR